MTTPSLRDAVAKATNVGHQATLAIYGHPYTESVEDAATGLVNHALADALTKEGE